MKCYALSSHGHRTWEVVLPICVCLSWTQAIVVACPALLTHITSGDIVQCSAWSDVLLVNAVRCHTWGLLDLHYIFFSFGQQHNEKHTGMTRATVSASCATPGNNTLPPHLPGFPYGGGHWAQRGSRAIGQGSEVKGHSLSHWLGGGNWSTSPTSAYCLSPSRNISLKRSRTFSYRETHIVHVTSCLGTPNTSIILVLCQMSAIDFWQIFWSGLTNSTYLTF